ncbi:Protein SDA1 [Cyanidiococcus yangmingshanensis]|uniref:Protein SDA1 n=1 Tax=Cyanidiococcus yangmingshanensis TaxID=2690220 RepID=A0A7J7IN45_9RHOD|nr:Protein SDA1 [Cyanidiococcus yangmingshanensis]
MTLDPDLRFGLVQALARFRARSSMQFLALPDLVDLYLQLLSYRDKSLRRFVSGKMLAELRRTKEHHRLLHEKVKTRLLQVSQRMLPDADASAARPMLRLFFMAYRRNLWRGDGRLVQLIADTCFHSSTVVATQACRFLLEADRAGRDSADSDRDTESGSTESDAMESGVNGFMPKGKSASVTVDSSSASILCTRFKRTQKKSSRRKQRFLRQMRRAQHKGTEHDHAFEAVANANGTESHMSEQPILTMLFDPQAFVERLLNQLKTRHEKFEFKLLVLQLACRCCGACRLTVPSLYPVLQRYLMPSQREETRILAMLVDAVHSEVPAELVTPILRHLAYYFVSDRRADQVVAIGLNTVRELCARVPDAMDAILLQDLVQYRKSRCRGIMMAARGVLQLYRRVMPSLLPRRDRGRPPKPFDATLSRSGGAATAAATASVDGAADPTEEVSLSSRSESESSMLYASDASWARSASSWNDDLTDSSGQAEATASEAELEESASENEFLNESISSDIIPVCAPAMHGDTRLSVEGHDAANETSASTDVVRNEDTKTVVASTATNDTQCVPSHHAWVEVSANAAGTFAGTQAEDSFPNRVPQTTSVRFEEPFRPTNPNRLESTFVRRRRSLEERLEAVRRGRQGRPRYNGDPHRHHKKSGGLSNTEKAKRKNIAMLRPKIVQKKRHRGRKRGPRRSA